MSLRTAVAALLVTLIFFSGCFGDSGGDPAGSDPSGSGSPTTSPAGSTEPGFDENLAPLAVLKVTSNGTELAPVNGSFVVDSGTNITFDASGSSDPDADNLTFAWTIDGNATDAVEPQLVVALAAGNHSVDVVVGDGSLEASANALVVAVSTAPAAGSLSYAFGGSFAEGTTRSQVVSHSFEIPVGAVKLVAYLWWDDGRTSRSSALADLDLFLHSPDSKEAETGETLLFEYVVVSDPEILVPGTWTAKVMPFGNAQSGGDGMPTTTSWSLKLVVWTVEPEVKTFTGSKPGVNSGTTGTGHSTHDVDIPVGVTSLTARLTWKNAASSTGTGSRANNYDLVVVAGGATQFSSTNTLDFEFGMKGVPPGESLPTGTWTFNVNTISVAAGDYTLVVEYA